MYIWIARAEKCTILPELHVIFDPFRESYGRNSLLEGVVTKTFSHRTVNNTHSDDIEVDVLSQRLLDCYDSCKSDPLYSEHNVSHS